jgi:UDP-glucose 6-dehydrogenase
MATAVMDPCHTGTVTAAAVGSKGDNVWGVDIDDTKIDEIRAGRRPAAEPWLGALVVPVVHR